MGIATGAAELLFKLSKKIKFKGSLLQVGNQDILFSSNKLLKLLKKYNYSKIKLNNKKKIKSKFFFKLFNLDNIKSIDINKYENADIIEDLNFPIKKKYYSNFDSIYDGGSLEHVFNISEGLQNLNKMLKPNGYIMHLLPCNNYIDHGFYSISPTLLRDFYIQNNYIIIENYLVKQKFDLSKNSVWQVYNYEHEKIKYYNKWNWGNNRMLVWIVAKKTKKINKFNYPTQSKYLKLYKKDKINKNKNSFKNYIRNKYPRSYRALKISKYNLLKIIKDDKKIKLNKKPKLLFRC